MNVMPSTEPATILPDQGLKATLLQTRNPTALH
jgi:hypothetical protein